MIRRISKASLATGFQFFMRHRLHRSCEVCKDVVAPIDAAIQTPRIGLLCMRCAVRLKVVEVEGVAA